MVIQVVSEISVHANRHPSEPALHPLNGDYHALERSRWRRRKGGYAARAIRFLPYPVIGGFLGATGWLMVTGAIQVVANLREKIKNPRQHVGWYANSIV